MKTQIYFSSIDQQVGPEVGAYLVICVLIMGQLHVNPRSFPNKKELNALIQHGLDEWNKLKEITSLKKTFEDGDFNLDCIIEEKLNSMTANFMKSKQALLKPKGMISKFKISQDKTINKTQNTI